MAAEGRLANVAAEGRLANAGVKLKHYNIKHKTVSFCLDSLHVTLLMFTHTYTIYNTGGQAGVCIPTAQISSPYRPLFKGKVHPRTGLEGPEVKTR